ncbi:MAG: hypothetical protein AAF443_07310 [Chlamydiota bacterium]
MSSVSPSTSQPGCACYFQDSNQNGWKSIKSGWKVLETIGRVTNKSLKYIALYALIHMAKADSFLLFKKGDIVLHRDKNFTGDDFFEPCNVDGFYAYLTQNGTEIGKISHISRTKLPDGISISTDGEHFHAGKTETIGNHSHPLPVDLAPGIFPNDMMSLVESANNDENYRSEPGSGAAGAHSHSFVTNTSGVHTHTIDGGDDENSVPHIALGCKQAKTDIYLNNITRLGNTFNQTHLREEISTEQINQDVLIAKNAIDIATLNETTLAISNRLNNFEILNKELGNTLNQTRFIIQNLEEEISTGQINQDVLIAKNIINIEFLNETVSAIAAFNTSILNNSTYEFYSLLLQLQTSLIKIENLNNETSKKVTELKMEIESLKNEKQVIPAELNQSNDSSFVLSVTALSIATLNLIGLALLGNKIRKVNNKEKDLARDKIGRKEKVQDIQLAHMSNNKKEDKSNPYEVVDTSGFKFEEDDNGKDRRMEKEEVFKAFDEQRILGKNSSSKYKEEKNQEVDSLEFIVEAETAGNDRGSEDSQAEGVNTSDFIHVD